MIHAPGASPNVGISYSDCSKVGCLVEYRLKQKEAYGLDPAQFLLNTVICHFGMQIEKSEKYILEIYLNY